MPFAWPSTLRDNVYRGLRWGIKREGGALCRMSSSLYIVRDRWVGHAIRTPDMWKSAPTVFQNELFQSRMPAHNIRMRMEELTPKELSSVRCPTCGVAAGQRCHLHSGSPRVEPHLDRKLSAIEALEQKKILDANLRAASKYLRAKLD